MTNNYKKAYAYNQIGNKKYKTKQHEDNTVTNLEQTGCKGSLIQWRGCSFSSSFGPEASEAPTPP